MVRLKPGSYDTETGRLKKPQKVTRLQPGSYDTKTGNRKSRKIKRRTEDVERILKATPEDYGLSIIPGTNTSIAIPIPRSELRTLKKASITQGVWSTDQEGNLTRPAPNERHDIINIQSASLNQAESDYDLTKKLKKYNFYDETINQYITENPSKETIIRDIQQDNIDNLDTSKFWGDFKGKQLATYGLIGIAIFALIKKI